MKDKLILWTVAGMVFVMASSWYAWFVANNALEEEIAVIEARFQKMSADHQRSIEAANEAIKARNEVYEYAQNRALELEGILNACPNLGNMLIPDRLRHFIENQNGSGEIPPPGGVAGADKAPSPPGSANGG